MTIIAPDPRDPVRPGEETLAFCAAAADDARLAFIGRVESPWRRDDCPKNLSEARRRGRPAALHIDPLFRPALAGLAPGVWVHLLTWLGGARRDLAVQAPRHAPEPRGTFTLRSPARPNPIGLHLVRIESLDAASGRIGIDAVDVFDGTPLLDIKPYLPGVDVAPEGNDSGREPS